MKLRIVQILLITSAFCLTAASYAQRNSELSSDLPDSRIMAIQDKVEQLFNAGEYERAFFIYRNELAPNGDKYAQYMVAYMYHNGLGTDPDPVAAAAWYRLAADRGTPEFVAVRDKMLGTLAEDELAAASESYEELRLKYSDMAVLLASIKRNMREMRRRTGSRLGSQSSGVIVLEKQASGFGPRLDHYDNLRHEVEARLRLMKELGDFPDLPVSADRINLRELERLVVEQIRSTSD